MPAPSEAPDSHPQLHAGGARAHTHHMYIYSIYMAPTAARRWGTRTHTHHMYIYSVYMAPTAARRWGTHTHTISIYTLYIWHPPLHAGEARTQGLCRVGQNHIYTVYVRHFRQENHQIYGCIRYMYTALANPRLVPEFNLFCNA
jgi:hypothetical protein